jgi:putative PIN family toxin of toxin-antitoxin system
MRLAVFDTNIIISAGIKRHGAPATLVIDWALEGQLQVVVCPSVVTEYRQVARRSKFLAHGFPPLWLELLIEGGLHLPEPNAWPDPLPDPKDAPFLALSRASGAWLVTGNLKHFPEKSRSGAIVLSPADYLAHLQSGVK